MSVACMRVLQQRGVSRVAGGEFVASDAVRPFCVFSMVGIADTVRATRSGNFDGRKRQVFLELGVVFPLDGRDNHLVRAGPDA